MEYREFGQTGMRLSAVALGGLLAHYEGVKGHPPAEEKQGIYRRALGLGVNLFDMGYGDEAYIPDELKRKVIELAPRGEDIRPELDLIYPLVSGPWRELARPGEDIPPTNRAIRWVLQNPGVNSVLVAVASVAELEEALDVKATSTVV